MKSIAIGSGLTADDLYLVDSDIPEIGPDEVLIKVIFAGVNRPDILQRRGKYLPPKDASPILGLEASGEIVKIGGSVNKWKVGDRVTSLLHGGGYAEFVAANQYHCLRIPNKMPILEAGSLCENYFTVWSNLFSRGKLRPGENVLIHGGTSGIGISAIQLSLYFGAKVWTTAGSIEKCQFCKEMGVDGVINYRQQSFVDFFQLREKPIYMDVIMDMVGGSYIEKNLQLLNEDGRMIHIAFLDGATERIDFSKIMMKRLTLTGSTLRPQSVWAKAKIAESLDKYIWPLLDQKKLRPVIDSVFDMKEVSLAHKRMESSDHIGKIMLKVSN